MEGIGPVPSDSALVNPDERNTVSLTSEGSLVLRNDTLAIRDSDLDEMLRHGSRYCINFDWLIERDEAKVLKGAYANIYQGILHPEGRKVAVRIVHQWRRDHGDKLVLREVQLWCQLRHRNILPLLGITTAFADTVAMVSPWMDQNAHGYVQDRTIDPRPLIQGIANGLCYLHNHQPPVFHGDVKGTNVLISPEDQPLLTGFGLSRLADPVFDTPSEPRGGTLLWMAPENMGTGGVSREGDVWAFGMTALELFTAKLPFHDIHPHRLVRRIMKGPPNRPKRKDTYSRLIDEWWQICSLCWKRDPLSRPNMSELVDAIVTARDETSSRHTAWKRYLPTRAV
ncbi:kinase-like domain-containing protein [Scleroderma citrinum]